MLEHHVDKDGSVRIYDRVGVPTNNVLVGVQVGQGEGNEKGRYDSPAAAMVALHNLEVSLERDHFEANFGSMFCREGRGWQADDFFHLASQALNSEIRRSIFNGRSG